MTTITYNPTQTNHRNGGIQHIYRFENSRFSASVVKTPTSYGGESGLWELAVKLDEKIIYNAPIASNNPHDVIGWLTDTDVQTILAQIDGLTEAK
jgi:hypothetical protein